VGFLAFRLMMVCGVEWCGRFWVDVDVGFRKECTMSSMKSIAARKSVLKLVALVLLVGPVVSSLTPQAFAMPVGSSGGGRGKG
jgi:hypothetical protein